MDDGAVIQNQNIEYGKYPQRPLNPQKDNYTFKGWYTVDQSGNYWNEFQFQSEITNDMLIYAKFEPNTYQITYSIPNGAYSSNPKEYVYGIGIKGLSDCSLDGYIFNGWYRDSEFRTKVTNIQPDDSGDITLYAKFDKLKYSVEYTLNGGTNNLSNPNEYSHGDYYKLLEPTKEGYIFKGWYEDTEYKTKRTQIDPENAQNFKLYALWKPKKYNIYFKLAGGNFQNAQNYEYSPQNGVSSLPVPYREGYEFLGWYSDFQHKTLVTSIDKGTHGDITLYASWSAKEFQITYNLNGGINNPNNPNTYQVDQTPFRLLDAQKTGYKFDGWYSQEDYKNRIYYLDGITSQVTLHAKWVAEQEQLYSNDSNTTEQNTQQNRHNKADKIKIILIQSIQVMFISTVMFICWILHKKSTQQNVDADASYKETTTNEPYIVNDESWIPSDEFTNTIENIIANKDKNNKI